METGHSEADRQTVVITDKVCVKTGHSKADRQTVVTRCVCGNRTHQDRLTDRQW